MKEWNATPADEIIKCISSDRRSRTRFISWLSRTLFSSFFHSFAFTPYYAHRILEIIMYLCNCMAIPLFFPMGLNSNAFFYRTSSTFHNLISIRTFNKCIRQMISPIIQISTKSIRQAYWIRCISIVYICCQKEVWKKHKCYVKKSLKCYVDSAVCWKRGPHLARNN